MNTDKKNRINEQILERYILGELPVEQRKEIEKQAEKDAGLKKDIRILQKSNRDILQHYSPAVIVPQIIGQYETELKKSEKKRSGRPLFFRRLLLASPAFAAVLILILFILPAHRVDVNPAHGINDKESTRIKGSSFYDMSKPHLVIHKQVTADRIELLKNGAKAKSGDVVQLAYAVPETAFGVILSIDGSGVVTLHFPEEKSGPTALEKMKRIPLPHAYELDDAPEFERFFFITSKSEINTSGILEKAALLAKNPVRARTCNIEVKGMNQFSILIEKENKQ